MNCGSYEPLFNYQEVTTIRKKASRSLVMKAALDLFSRQGYSETKMRDIAKAVGISVGALYLRFRNKEALCKELIQDQAKEFIERTNSLPLNDPLGSMKEYISLNINYAMKRRQIISLFMREYDLPFLKNLKKNFFHTQHEIIKQILKEGIRQKIFKKVDMDGTAAMIFASIRGVILLRVAFGFGNSGEMSNLLYQLITKGIRKDI
jgi:AcrR family transcriptional regulator